MREDGIAVFDARLSALALGTVRLTLIAQQPQHNEAQRRYEAWLRDDENGGGEARRDAIRIAIQAALLGPQTTA